MQSGYGLLPWQRDVSPGEGYAAAGFPISRALAARLNAAQDVIRLDAGLAAEFMDESGKVKPEGTSSPIRNWRRPWRPCASAGRTDSTRARSARGSSPIRNRRAAASACAEFGGYTALRGTPQAMQMGMRIVFLPSQHTGAGAFAGTLFDNLNRAQSTNAGAADLQASVVYAVKQALSRYAITSLPADLGATGFAAIDSNGQAAACAVTMNGPFGSGHNCGWHRRHAGARTIIRPGRLASAFLTPVIATKAAAAAISLVGAGAGGPNGTAAIGYALARLGSGESLTSSSDMRSTGVPYDTVNAIACQNGSCVALPDPAANGTGASGDTGR